MPPAPPTPAEALARAMRRIYALGLTTTSGGNLSVRGARGDVWITPAGLDKGELRPEDVACVSPRGARKAGPAPSSELPFHRAIYAARADLAAIVHAHPVSLVAFSVARRVPDVRISADAFARCGDVGFAPYALPGSRALGDSIAAAFARGPHCVVLENHGVAVGGASLGDAFARLEMLDVAARTELAARALGGVHPLAEADLALVSRRGGVAPRGHPEIADVAEERALRASLCRLARRSAERRLMTSTQGALSARVSRSAFLMTPIDRPLDDLSPRDVERFPLRAGPEAQGAEERRADRGGLALHRALYRAHPDVGAIAHGVPAHASAFGVARADLPSRTIPESYILVRDPERLPFRTTRTDPDAVAARLGPDRPVAVVENDGAIALGRTALEAFDRLEVLEATASAVLASRALGPLSAMGDAVIEDLRAAFFPAGGL